MKLPPPPHTPETFSPSGFFAFRVPLRAFDELLAWSDALESPHAGDAAALDLALAADRRALRERLAAIAGRPEVREALFVASPSLEESLVRYVSRMAGRATPFGLFARACAAVAVAETLADARRRLAALDETGLGAAPNCYRDVARLLQPLPVTPDSTIVR